MATNIGPKIGIDGEAQYRKQINSIIQQANTLASEMKAVTASFDANTTAQEQAAAKGTVLAKQIEVQEQRVVELTKMLWKASEKYGDVDNKTLKWQQSLNNAKADLFKMRHEMDSLNAAMEETEPPELIFDEAGAKRALSVIEQEARTLASELKLLSAELDDTASAEDRLTQKKTALTRQIGLQEQRVETLERAVQQATEAYGENDTATMRWQQSLNEAKLELVKLERELRDTERELEDVGDAANDAASPIRRAGNAMDDAAGGAFTLGKALTAGGIIEGGKAIIGVLVDLIERTEEYRRIMASLELSSGRAGYTAEETSEGFDLLYGVLGDDQSSATALANLQALGVSQSDLKLLINGTVGAWSAYGDSIPIDGLAEAINETVQVGKVTGTFADVLNWAGHSEDEFNAKLEAAETQAERTAIVLQELADQGLVDLGAAWQENNKDIVANNNATNDLNRAYARFAGMAAPSVNMVKQETANLLNSLVDLMTGTSQLDAQVNDVMNRLATEAGNLFGELDAWSQELADSIGDAVDSASDDLETLIDNAAGWGKDFLAQYRLGILGEVPDLELTVEQVAALVNSYLHFSVPDVGPLADADEYGPDFIKLLSGGIRDHLPELENAVNMAAESMVIQPHVIAGAQGGSVNTVNRIDGFTVNVYAAEGQSPQDVAEAVKDMIYAEVTRKEAVFGA